MQAISISLSPLLVADTLSLSKDLDDELLLLKNIFATISLIQQKI